MRIQTVAAQPNLTYHNSRTVQIADLRTDSREMVAALQHVADVAAVPGVEAGAVAKASLRGSIEERGLALNSAVLEATHNVVQVKRGRRG